MAREGSKRNTAIEIMSSNSDKPMAEVLPLIAKANDIDVSAARSYYVWLVNNKLAPGKVERLPRSAAQPAKKTIPARRGRPPNKLKMVASKKRPVKKYSTKK
jgi:hypothetical protein